MIRRPPRSTLFPTRRSSDLSAAARCCSYFWATSAARALESWRCAVTRSEEHTSELQSLTNLVCRLLLEKKKNIHLYKYLFQGAIVYSRSIQYAYVMTRHQHR